MTGTAENIPATLDRLTIPITQLTPRRGNPRRGDTDVIAQSLQRNGQYRPIVVNKPTSEVLAGNHTLAAAKQLGWQRIAVTFVDVDDDQAARIVLADNRTADLGTYDDAALYRMLQDLDDDYTGTGYEYDDLARLEALNTLDPNDGGINGDPDDVPEPPAAPITKPGDVWLLGRHRVTCGDSTDPATISRACGDTLVDAVWTDPPYGVTYTGVFANPIDREPIANDSLKPAELEAFLRAAFTAAATHTKPGAAWYVSAPPGPLFLVFGAVLNDMGIWRQTLIWVKSRFIFGRSDYHYRHEPIFYGWDPRGPRLHPVADRTQDTVLEFDRPPRSPEHPTMKPIALIAHCLTNSTDRGNLVLDPFGGSGSTLIAAETIGLTACLAEIDPGYVDVTCSRWQKLAGGRPVLEATGEPCNFD